MPVLTDEDVGIAPRTFSDADVGLTLSDEDVGLVAPPPREPEQPSIPIVASLIQKPAGSSEELSARNFYDAWKATGQMPTLANESFWNNLNDPLVNWAPRITAQDAQVAVDTMAAPSAEASLAEPTTPAGTGAKIAAGAQNAIAETLDAFTSPLGIATLGLSALPKVAQSILTAAFAAHMATTLPGQAKAAVEAIKAGDVEGASRNITSTLLTGTLTGLAGKHSVEAGKAALVETAKVVGPVTELVISKETGKEPSPAVSAPEPVVPPATAAGEIKTPIPAESPAAIGPSVPDITPPIEKPLVGLGAATPAEFDLKPQNPTSIKNAVVDQERAARGLPPAMKPLRQSDPSVWDAVMAKIDSDPGYTDRLLDEFREKPRSATAFEDFTLLHRQVELRNHYDKANRDLVQAVDDGRLEDAASEKLRLDALSNQMLDLFNIDKTVGTETARGLNARKAMAYEDFSLAKMELEKRAAKNGEQLTEAERAEVVRLNQKIEQTQKTYDDYVATAEQRIAALEVERALAALERQARQEPVLDPKASSLAERIVKSMEKQADESRAYLSGKLFTVSPDVLFHLSRIGAAQIARGTLEFSRWSTAMLTEFGEKIRPHLQTVFDAANKYLDDKVTSDAGPRAAKTKRVMAKTDLNEQQAAVTENIKTKMDAGEADSLTPLVQKLARIFVERGVKERNALIDAVHAELVKIDPNITRRDTMDAISGYGKYSQLTKEQISVELRDLKGQMQQVAKLEDIEARKPPLKTGVERRTPTDEERKLIKQVNEAKRKFGVVVTDPATQLKSALASRKTYYQNQIADLEAQIASKQKFVKEKTPSPTDPELEALKAKRKTLKEEFDEIFEKPGLTEEQREMRAIELEKKRLEKQIAEQERKLQESDIAPKGRPVNRPANPEIEPLKQRRDALNKQLAEARKKPASQKEADRIARRLEQLNKLIAAREAKIAAGDTSSTSRQRVNRPLQPELESARQRLDVLNEQLAEMRKGPSRTPEEIALKTLKTRLANTIKTLEDKLARGDFTKKPKRTIQLDPEATRLHFEAAKAKAKWHEGLMKDRLARRSLPAKIIGGVGETVNTIRAIITSGEFSGVLRQGGILGLGNPIRIAKGFPAMMRALRSEAQQHAVNMEIMARPNYPLYVRSKLFLSEHGQKLSQMEEAYMSRWAEKIPVVAGTQRAYSTFLNKLRADSFDALASKTVRRTGELTPDRARDIANLVNVFTGRGNLAGKEAALVAMNTYFFAPRWVASRFQTILGQPFYRAVGRRDWPMVRIIAEEYGKFLIALGVIYGLVAMSGGEVEDDPRSSDFGKLRVGETRVDLMAGLQQQTVLLSRLGTGKTKRLSGKIVPIRGEDIPFGSDDSAQVIGRFLRTKLAPVPASTVDTLSGKDVTGEPVTLESELMELTVPLTYRDIYKAMIEQGVPVGTALSLLAIFGAGVQTYD